MYSQSSYNMLSARQLTYGALLNGNRVVKVPRYWRSVAISASLYVETAFREYRIIGGLTVLLSEKTVMHSKGTLALKTLEVLLKKF